MSEADVAELLSAELVHVTSGTPIEYRDGCWIVGRVVRLPSFISAADLLRDDEKEAA